MFNETLSTTYITQNMLSLIYISNTRSTVLSLCSPLDPDVFIASISDRDFAPPSLDDVTNLVLSISIPAPCRPATAPTSIDFQSGNPSTAKTAATLMVVVSEISLTPRTQ